MNKYLVSATEVYRVDTEESAAAIVDEWYQVTLVKKFNDEKDPISNINVNYEVSF